MSDIEGLSDLITDDVLAQIEGPFQDVITVVFDQMVTDVTSGDPAAKQAVMKLVIPLLIKAKKDSEAQGEDIEQLRAEVRDLFTKAGKEMGPQSCPHCGELVD